MKFWTGSKNKHVAVLFSLINLSAFAANTGRGGLPIVQIETRDAKITIVIEKDESGDSEQKYLVKNMKGEILADRLTLAELETKLPAVYAFLKSAIVTSENSFSDRQRF